MARSKSPLLWQRVQEMKTRVTGRFPDDRTFSTVARYGCGGLRSTRRVEQRMKEWVRYA